MYTDVASLHDKPPHPRLRQVYIARRLAEQEKETHASRASGGKQRGRQSSKAVGKAVNAAAGLLAPAGRTLHDARGAVR